MSQELPTKHPKQDFQVERLAFFSDAVFAIAITLLVLEFKVPHVTESSTYAEIWGEIVALKLKFAALLLSFFLIASYWIRHHLLFKHIHDYNRSILMCNLIMLLPVIFFPLTTAFFYEAGANKAVTPLAVQVFLVNNIAASTIIYILYWMIVKKYPHMSYPLEEKDKEVFKHRVFWMTISMVCMLVISFISFNNIAYGLIPMVAARLYKLNQKKKPTKHNHA